MENEDMDIDWDFYLKDNKAEFDYADVDNTNGECTSGSLEQPLVLPAMDDLQVEAEQTTSAYDGYLSERYKSDVFGDTTIDPSLLGLYHLNSSNNPHNSDSSFPNGHTNLPHDNCETALHDIDASQDTLLRQRHIIPNVDHNVSGDTPVTTTKAKNSRRNLPKAAVEILKAWLFEHESDPYPSQAEKVELSARSGLQLSQLNYWFMNARRRTLHSGYESSVSLSESESVRSIGNSRGRMSQRFDQLKRNSSNGNLSSSALDSDSSASRPPRRGRKRKYSNDMAALNQKRSRSVSTTVKPNPDAKPEPMFQCTFCRVELTSKSWRRHEETQHAPQVFWTCMATGHTLEIDGIDPKAKISVCAFCGDVVDNFCLKPHRIADCQTRKEDERVFYRKEHLRRHFRNFHPESKLTDQVAAAWKSVPNSQPRSWPCGFCGQRLGNWSLRESHIAQHFREGATMHSWSLDHARRYYPKNQDDVLGAKVPLEDHGFLPSILCPHPATENTSTSLVEYPKSIDFRSYDINFPLSAYHSFPSAPDWGSRTSLWYCYKQTSFVLHAQHEGSQCWLRYPFDSLCNVSCSPSYSSRLGTPIQCKSIEFDQKPDVFIQGVEDPWVDRCRYRRSRLDLEFTSTKNSTAFATWLSTATFSSLPSVKGGMDCWLCWLCRLSFKSSASCQMHRLYHEGAYVDVFGCSLQLTARIDNDSLDVLRNFYDLRFMLDRVGFRCGSSLVNGNSWGCKKIFGGLSAFAEHLKSSVGSICWIPLLTCAAISVHTNSGLAPYTAHSGLPAELFRIYPALNRVQWDEVANRTLLSERVPDLKPLVWEQSDALSTIASVSTRTESVQ